MNAMSQFGLTLVLYLTLIPTSSADTVTNEDSAPSTKCEASESYGEIHSWTQEKQVDGYTGTTVGWVAQW